MGLEQVLLKFGGRIALYSTEVRNTKLPEEKDHESNRQEVQAAHDQEARKESPPDGSGFNSPPLVADLTGTALLKGLDEAERVPGQLFYFARMVKGLPSGGPFFFLRAGRIPRLTRAARNLPNLRPQPAPSSPANLPHQRKVLAGDLGGARHALS
jgi:hypothetical protein